MRYRVVFAKEAKRDLFSIHDFIRGRAGDLVALGFVERLERSCQNLSTFPNRGTRRDHIRPGLRVVGFERRVSIAFVVREQSVIILRVLYGGQDLERAFR